MRGYLRLLLFALVAIMLTACAPAPMTPPKIEGASIEDMPLTDNMSDAINDVMDALGSAPENVIGFGIGFNKPKATPISADEIIMLRSLYETAQKTFSSPESTMGCSPFIFQEPGSVFIGKLGYNKYDKLGNLNAEIGKTVIHIVSADKVKKKSGSEGVKAIIEATSAYAYWIESLPDGNALKGTVYNLGTDGRKDDPVKRGTLFFKRIGPNPSSPEEEISVNSDGSYDISSRLTAGHYEVAFDPLDGKGKKIINANWLFIPGEHLNTDQDWFVLVNKTYKITYDHVAKLAGSNEIVNTLHMQWHAIPIDWPTTSDDALTAAKEASLVGTYCITYDYENVDASSTVVSDDNEDDSETEITPGYSPDVYSEEPLEAEGGIVKLPYRPTLSLYRGAKDGDFVEGDYYLSIPVEIVIETPVMSMGTAIVPGIFDPLPNDFEKSYRTQGWEDWAFLGHLDSDQVLNLIEGGKTLVIEYTHPNGAYVKVTIEEE